MHFSPLIFSSVFFQTTSPFIQINASNIGIKSMKKAENLHSLLLRNRVNHNQYFARNVKNKQVEENLNNGSVVKARTFIS